MQSRAARVARGSVAGAFATAVAAVAHGLADGAAPSTLAIVVGLVFATLLGTLAIGRRRSIPRLVIVAGGSQVAFHLVFASLTPGTATVVGHHATGMIAAPATHHAVDPTMWAAHAVALVATIVFLRRAESALWGLLAAVLEALGVALVPTLPHVARPARVPAAPHRVAHATERLLTSVLSRRGPPALARA